MKLVVMLLHVLGMMSREPAAVSLGAAVLMSSKCRGCNKPETGSQEDGRD
jgi:hypothetical protein